MLLSGMRRNREILDIGFTSRWKKKRDKKTFWERKMGTLLKTEMERGEFELKELTLLKMGKGT